MRRSILFVYHRPASFVDIDRDLLAGHHHVETWTGRHPLLSLPALVRAVRRSDLVFGWFAGWHTLGPVLVARLLRRPSLLVVGGVDVARMPEIGYGAQSGGVRRRLARWAMRAATALVTNSEFSRGEVVANAGMPPAKVTVVYHGVPDPFGGEPAVERARAAVTVGVVDRRNLERKGLRPFVAAAAHLPDVQFALLGRWDDDAIDELRGLAGANVELAGWVAQDELERRLSTAAVYVQPSRHEGFGMAVAEAMLAGCIPVVARAGALPEVVGDAGIVVDEPDPAAVAAGIARALESGPDARRRARRRVLERFPLSARERGLLAAVDGLLRPRA